MGMIVMRHNEHQIEDFRRLGESLGADNVELLKPCVRTEEQGRRYLTDDPTFWIYDREAFLNEGILRIQETAPNWCTWIWYTCQITWNGDVVPCCQDALGRFVMGNVFEEPLERIWNNEKYRAFRRRVLEDQGNIAMCRLCQGYGAPVMYEKEPPGATTDQPEARRTLDLPDLRDKPRYVLPQGGHGEGVAVHPLARDEAARA